MLTLSYKLLFIIREIPEKSNCLYHKMRKIMKNAQKKMVKFSYNAESIHDILTE